MSAVLAPIKPKGETKYVVRRTQPVTDNRVYVAPRKRRASTETVSAGQPVLRLMAWGVVGLVLFYMAYSLLGAFMLESTRQRSVRIKSQLQHELSKSDTLTASVDQLAAPQRVAAWAEQNGMTRAATLVTLRPTKGLNDDNVKSYASIGAGGGD
jgi:cell division protein FtsL